MKTNLRLLFTLLFVVSVVALRAGTMNDIRVSGTVVSEGDPLPGVSVLVKEPASVLLPVLTASIPSMFRPMVRWYSVLSD